MADQLVFDLAHRTAFEREDFLVSKSNAAAVHLVDSWPDWPYEVAFLHGPKSSGKTHLLNVWAERASPVFVQKTDTQNILERIEEGHSCYALDDVEGFLTSRENEETLFHLINHIRHKKGSLLMTSDRHVNALSCSLADLHSRIKASYSVEIHAPDDDLLAALCLKHLSDRQLRIDPDALNYLISRSERSFSTVLKNVETLDKASLKEKRRLTLPFIKKTLGF